jgi:diacylglycerol O-acyltransferase
VSHKQKMSPVDHAWLRMDSPTNLMMIVGVFVLSESVSFNVLKEVISNRLLMHRRFSQTVQQDASGAWWVDDAHFDIHHHVVHSALPAGIDATQADLQAHIAFLATQRLDAGKPLWQMHVVENYQGGTVLIVRVHHCIADGVALIGVILSMTENESGVTTARVFEPDRAKENVAWRMVFEPMTKWATKAIDLTGSVWQKYWQVIHQPHQLWDYAKVLSQAALDATQIALMPSDTPTSLKGKPSSSKQVAWCDPIPLHEVKMIGAFYGCSVNDVLLSCVAGAIGRYLERHDERLADCEVRTMIPVNLRKPEQMHLLGNRFGLVPLTLPVGMTNPISRLYEIRSRMNELKESYKAALSMGILGLVGLFPKLVQHQILDMIARKATAVMTNVPGPQTQLYLAGAPINQMMFWVPQSGDIGLGVSVLSYNGGVQFGLIADVKLCPDPQQVIDYFQPEFETLVLTTLLQNPNHRL